MGDTVHVHVSKCAWTNGHSVREVVVKEQGSTRPEEPNFYINKIDKKKIHFSALCWSIDLQWNGSNINKYPISKEEMKCTVLHHMRFKNDILYKTLFETNAINIFIAADSQATWMYRHHQVICTMLIENHLMTSAKIQKYHTMPNSIWKQMLSKLNSCWDWIYLNIPLRVMCQSSKCNWFCWSQQVWSSRWMRIERAWQGRSQCKITF